MNNTEKAILTKMLLKDVIGKHHLKRDTIAHCVERQTRGEIDTALKNLVKQGYIEKHSHEHGDAYTIPPWRVTEIKKLLGL